MHHCFWSDILDVPTFEGGGYLRFLSPLGLFTVDGSVSIPALASPLASENSINLDMVTGDAFVNMAGPDSPIDQVQALEQMRVDLLEPKLGKVLKGFN